MATIGFAQRRRRSPARAAWPPAPPASRRQPGAAAAQPGAPVAGQSRFHAGDRPDAAAGRRLRRAAAAGDVGPGQRAGPASITSGRSAPRAQSRPITIPAGSRRRSRRAIRWRCRRPRPSGSTSCRPTSRSATSSGRRGSTGSSSTTISTPRSRTRCCAARLRTHQHRRRAQRPASDPPAICRAQGGAGDDPGEPRRRSSTASGSTWTAGAGCRATSAQKYIIVNVPGFHATLVENGVNRWKQRAIAGKLIKTPTPQLIGDGGRRDPQPVVGSAARASSRRSRARRASCRSRARTARSSAGASRRGRPTRSARSSS